MPHVILECSNNISELYDFKKFFVTLHEYLSLTLPTQISSCKSRVQSYSQCYLGKEGEQESFIHITIKIIAGRSDETKKQIGVHVLALLEQIAQEYTLAPSKLSIEILDLNTHYYKN